VNTLSVSVRGLRKVFIVRARGRRASASELIAVDDVSFDLLDGGSLAIVGESGSGKTTVARMILGLERPTAGEITVAGRRRKPGRVSRAERRLHGREMQIVFQDPYTSLDPRQSVTSCIEEVLRLHFPKTADTHREQISRILDKVGISERHRLALPRELSGGQRQRVAIARALAAEPRVLVLDEAVSALDVSIQAQILNLLADLREGTRISYLLISHDLSVVRQISDEVLVMHRGVVVERGRTGAVLDDPQDDYTKRLRDAVPRPGWEPPTRAVAL
jgi:oligopeptide transport system ATP-binding protein